MGRSKFQVDCLTHSKAQAPSSSLVFGTWEHLEQIGSIVGRLRISVRHQLTILLRDIERHISDKVDGLATKSGMVDGSIRELLLGISWNSSDDLQSCPYLFEVHCLKGDIYLYRR